MIRIIIALLFLFSNLACQKKEDDQQIPVATVNSEKIPFSTFIVAYNRTKQSLEKDSKPDPATIDRLKEQTLNKLILDTLIQQEANRRNIVVTEDELKRDVGAVKSAVPPEQFTKSLAEQLLTEDEWIQLQKKRLISEKVARVSIDVDRNISPEEIRQFYDEHKAEFSVEKRVQASQIYVKDESLAEDLLKQLKKGASFEELAKKHSLSPDAEKGGDLGLFGLNEMIPEFNIAFQLRPGMLHPSVIKSAYGFHIIKTTKVNEARQLPLSEVRDTIVTRLIESREEARYKQWLNELVSKSTIEKNQLLISEFDKR